MPLHTNGSNSRQQNGSDHRNGGTNGKGASEKQTTFLFRPPLSHNALWPTSPPNQSEIAILSFNAPRSRQKGATCRESRDAESAVGGAVRPSTARTRSAWPSVPPIARGGRRPNVPSMAKRLPSSPWDDAQRRPSHADRRKALRRQIMERELSTLAAVRRLPRKILQLTKRLMTLAV